MRIVRHYKGVHGVEALDASARGAVIALGNFDGLHRGHLGVIDEAGRIAREAGAPWGVLTFEPHPRGFFQPGTPPFRITPFRTKVQRLAEHGLDLMYVLGFGPRLASVLAQDFVLDALVEGFGVRHVVVGPDFVFGKGRRGNAYVLGQMAAREGFGFTEIEAVEHGGGACSSTDVRVLIRRGLVDQAAAMLGWTWEIEGRVVRGEGRGRELGFPTANIPLDGRLHPGPGIFAVRVRIEGQGAAAWRDGVAYVGTKPTFGGETLALEVLIFDFDGDLYGRRLRAAFVKRVRKDQTFDGVESLKAQMAADCQRARQILAGAHADARADSGTGVADPRSNPPAA